MSNYLVTGVAGFIGAKVAEKLISLGHNVIGIDNFHTGYKENIPSQTTFHKIDIRNSSELEILEKYNIDAIFHIAGQSSGERSFDDPEYDLLTNTLGTLNLLLFSKKNKISRFLYASSMSIYGDVESPVKVNISGKICTTGYPKSYYGVSKLASEYYIRTFKNAIDITSFRMFNVYGPGQNMKNMKQGMVSIYLAFFMNNEPVYVKGNKNRFRDFIYIDDVVNAWVNSINNKKSFGKIYNLGSGKKTTVCELLKIMAKTWGDENYPIEYSSSGTPGDQFGIYADIKETIEDLNWKPSIDLETGMKHFISWVKEIKNA